MAPCPPAPSVLATTLTMYTTVPQQPSGMAPPLVARRTARAAWSTQQGISSAPTGHGQMAAQPRPTTPTTSTQDAASRLTELRAVLEHKRLDAASPYHPEAWQKHLLAAGLQEKYPGIPNDLQFGFDAGIRQITLTFTPPNWPSLYEHQAEFDEIVQTKLQRGRYVGPITQAEVEALLGTFHTSPLSIIPKPRQPGKFWIIMGRGPGDLASALKVSSVVVKPDHPVSRPV